MIKFTYLAFFHLKETDAVAQQLQIFLCTLSCHFGRTQLLVESLIVIFFVWSQVHLIVLDVVHVSRAAAVRGALHAVVVVAILSCVLAIVTVKVLVVHLG
jgi:hypothetical protein